MLVCDAGASVNITLLPLTLTAWFGSVPLGSPAAAHDTFQRGVALKQVASLAMKCHHGAQLVVSTHTSAIHQIARIKTCLTQFCCQSTTNNTDKNWKQLRSHRYSIGGKKQKRKESWFQSTFVFQMEAGVAHRTIAAKC